MDLNVPPLCSSLCNEDRIISREINDTGCSTCKHAANLEEKNESRKKNNTVKYLKKFSACFFAH